MTLFLSGLVLGTILGGFVMARLFIYAIEFTGDEQLVLVYKYANTDAGYFSETPLSHEAAAS